MLRYRMAPAAGTAKWKERAQRRHRLWNACRRLSDVETLIHRTRIVR